MAPDERETELRRRLAAYVARQTEVASAYDRLRAVDAREGPPGGAPPAAVRPSAVAAVAATKDLTARVTVVVPIHNAPDELRRCLWSVARNTTRAATLLLIDDASTDPGVDDVLAWAAELENVRILRSVQNLGFAATVNRALRVGHSDVVLLNSDTEVGPRWLEQLVSAAYGDPTTGTATPLADNAGAFSAPELDVANSIPTSLGIDDVARLVCAEAAGVRPLAPTGGGFCLYLRRSLVEAVGEMDAVNFLRGYGEETDYCMRAGRLGWRHVVDDRTFIHHRRSASFGPAKQGLLAASRRRMSELHPDYKAKVSAFIANPAMDTARSRVALALARGEREGAPRLRVLFVVHEGGGGAVATNRDLMGALGAEHECFSFSSDRHVLRLRRIEGPESEVLQEWPLERPLLLGDISRPDYRAAFSAALDRAAPELVHIRHLFKHTFDPPRLAASRELPTVLSFHDHYFICPTIHLLDEHGRYCGGTCTPGAGVCPTVRAGTLPPLKHAFVHQWREEVDAALADVDTFVTTSSYTRDIHRRFLSAVRGRPFELIEHGRDLTQVHGRSSAPTPGGQVRILVPGNLERHKGADLLAAMTRLDAQRRLELHFAGEVPERYTRLGVVHGAYERDDLAARVAEIQPAFVGVFSVTGESYSHAITEAWAAGVPVLATDLGAQAARVRAHGGGFVIPSSDPAAALAKVLAAADDTQAYVREQARAGIASVPSVAAMASRYADLYRDVIDRRRPFAVTARRRASPLVRGVWRMAAVGLPPGSLLGRRLAHPALRWKLRMAFCSEASEVDPATDGVLVTPGFLSPKAARSLVAQLSPQATPLVLLAQRAPDAGAMEREELRSGEVLLAASQMVIVPSSELGRIYSRRHGEVAVVAPALDERLFAGPGLAGPPLATSPRADDPVRLVWLAARVPAEELERLRTLLAQLRGGGGRRYELEIATCSQVSPDPGAYRHLPMPDPELSYVEYVSRLRELRERWHVALMPRIDDLDGDLRFLECAALGLPVVCSALEADGGVQAIQRLVMDSELADEVRSQAWRQVSAGRLMRQGAPQLLEVLGHVAAGGTEPIPGTVVRDAG